jgi:cytochrome c oxidase assembly factor CtaG
VLVLVPPVAVWARRYGWVEALQFSVLGIVAPAGFTLGMPWRRIGLGAWSERLAAGRRRHLELIRTIAFTILELAALTAWRIPGTVDWIARSSAGALVEALVLVPLGIAFWLECVESPPLVPRSTRPVRIAVAAVAMWTVWILAYLIGLSHSNWYRAYHYFAGRGISLAAEQQLTTGVLWFLAACAFVPVVFWNLVQWLKAEEDPDHELHRLARRERHHALRGPVRNRPPG